MQGPLPSKFLHQCRTLEREQISCCNEVSRCASLEVSAAHLREKKTSERCHSPQGMEALQSAGNAESRLPSMPDESLASAQSLHESQVESCAKNETTTRESASLLRSKYARASLRMTTFFIMQAILGTAAMAVLSLHHLKVPHLQWRQEVRYERTPRRWLGLRGGRVIQVVQPAPWYSPEGVHEWQSFQIPLCCYNAIRLCC